MTTCSKCNGENIAEIAKMSAVQDYIPGKDIDAPKAPLYFCRDCNEIIN